MEPYVSCLISVIVHIVMTRMRRNGELRLQRFMSNVYEKYMNFQIFLFLWSYIRKRCYNQVSDWALLGKSYAVFMYDKHNLCYTGSMYFGCQFDRERSHGIYPEAWWDWWVVSYAPSSSPYSQLQILQRGDHVWWPLATIRMLSDYWRAESNISMLPVCSWAPDHGAYSERRISPRRASEAPNAERKAGGDLARLGASWAQPWACSDAPQTIEKAAPWPVAVGPYRMVEVR